MFRNITGFELSSGNNNFKATFYLKIINNALSLVGHRAFVSAPNRTDNCKAVSNYVNGMTRLQVNEKQVVGW